LKGAEQAELFRFLILSDIATQHVSAFGRAVTAARISFDNLPCQASKFRRDYVN
jgi:hypothetical protein